MAGGIEVTFEVKDFPPAKNEALSMLGAGHGHQSRVRKLLEAARKALPAGFKPFSTAIGLDVTVSGPPGRDPWDATNYLGGIGDVLEDKTRRGTLGHLGGLEKVALYTNDRLIQEVHYSYRRAATASYRVRIWPLADSANRDNEPAPGG